MICALSVSHMISRCWFSFSLHVVPAQLVIQIFKVPFNAMKTTFFIPSLCIYIYNHMAFPVTTAPLTYSPLCASSFCHTQKTLSGF